MNIPFDQIQRARVHLLDSTYKTTICGMPLRKGSLTRTRDHEVVFGSLATYIDNYRANCDFDNYVQATTEDLTRPYLCETCLERELPNLSNYKRHNPWRTLKAYWAKCEKRAVLE